MSDKNRKGKDPQAGGDNVPPATEETVQTDRRRRRALIISALAAGGVFQLNGWQVQAHGNRSSHAVSTVQNFAFTPDDYVLMRQLFTAPNNADTQSLEQVTEMIRTADSGTDPETLAQLQATQSGLEDKLRLRSTTRQSLEFLSGGDPAAAIATIEGEGWPERVLGEYLWVLLDVAYLGRKDSAFTSEHLADFTTIGQAAVSYINKLVVGLPATNLSPQEKASKDRAAEILHNIAAFMLPDDGKVDDKQLALGRDSAEKALALRQQLGQPKEIARAHWMVGRHYQRIGDLDRAKNELDQARQMAQDLGDQATLAWSDVYLAAVLRSQGETSLASTLVNEAQSILVGADPSDVSLQFLRLQLQIDPSLGKA